jgi:DNA-binding beta-propeller fold protein YncE
MRRKTLRHTYALIALIGGVLLFGCWRDQDGPTETAPNVDEKALEPQFSMVAAEAMEAPVRVATTPKGRLLVSDSRGGMVLVVDPATLRPVEGFEVEGKPLAIGLLGKRVFVGNVEKRTIEIYDARGGSLQRSFGAGAVEYAMDLAIDEVLGLVFVVDGGAREVRVFDVHGSRRKTISGPGIGADRLQAPTGIAVDPARREVLISEYATIDQPGMVKIFDYGGNLVASISGAGSCGMMGCSGGFSRPQGLAVDGQGRIYVVDAVLAQVLVYDRETLERVDEFGGRGAGLRLPLDVAIDDGGNVFVTSNLTQSVEVYLGAAGQP